MKKYIPILLFIMAFSGFLSTQILWDVFNSNAENVEQNKQKYSIYEAGFQALKLTTPENSSIELRNETTPIVLLNFWASWCAPCLQEFPSMVEFQEKYKGKVRVIGINGDEEMPIENIQKIKQKYRLNFESVVDPESVISKQFLISGYPVSIIFHNGKVIYESKKTHNFMDRDFIALIDNALRAN